MGAGTVRNRIARLLTERIAFFFAAMCCAWPCRLMCLRLVLVVSSGTVLAG